MLYIVFYFVLELNVKDALEPNVNHQFGELHSYNIIVADFEKTIFGAKILVDFSKLFDNRSLQQKCWNSFQILLHVGRFSKLVGARDEKIFYFQKEICFTRFHSENEQLLIEGFR